MCVLISTVTLSETFLILRRVERDMIKKKYVNWSACKAPVVFGPILMKLVFSGQYFEKNTYILNFMKIRQVVAEFFHTDGRTDGRTDMTKLSAFRNFANAPKNVTDIASLFTVM